MRRIPLEYGDNFPVLTGSWNPTMPWRFPKYEVRPRSFFGTFLPWMMLGLGLLLGIFWMSRKDLPVPGGAASPGIGQEGSFLLPLGPSAHPAPTQAAPKKGPAAPQRLKSQLA